LAVAGHSTGARIALLAASMDHDLHDAILAAVAWDPIDFNTSNDPEPVSVTPEHMATMDAPALIFGTPESACVIAGDNHDDFFAAAKAPALHLFLPTADHLDWVDDYGEGAYGFSIANTLCNRVGPLNGVVVHGITRRSQVAWLKQHVNGEPGMQRYLTGSEARTDIDHGNLVVTEK
jgi:pimeloyl-ACP methyl ester carboxylesterase